MYAQARDLRVDTAQLYAPPADISVSNAVGEILVTPTGKYESDLVPYMRQPCDALASRRKRAVVFMGPGRCSKTASLVDGWTARNRKYAPGDQLIVQASQDLARFYSKIRLDRIIAASPELKSRISPRRQDDNTYDKIWRAGDVLSIGWPSGAQLSGRDYQYVAITEYDLADDDIDGEGSLFALASMRTQTFLSAGMVLAESSVRRQYSDPNWRAPAEYPHTAPPTTGITGLYNSGTRHWYYWRCPDCGAWMALHPDVHVMFNLPPLEQLVEELPERDAAQWSRERAVVPCRACGTEIREKSKRDLNLGGLWVPDGCKISGGGEIDGEPIDSDIDSYQLSCVAAAYASWPKILEKYAVAIQSYARSGSEVDIKSTVNLDQGRAYLPIAARKQRSNHDLQERAEKWPKHTVPLGARFLTAQFDVQAGKRPRFEVQIHAVGKNRERWIVDRFALKSSRRKAGEDESGNPIWHPIDPASYVEDWYRLVDKVILRRYPLADGSGRTMPVRFTVGDSGGKAGVTRRAYEFWRWLKDQNLHHRVRLSKGAEREGAKTWEEVYPDASKRNDRNSGAIGDVPVMLVNVTTLKDVVMADAFRDQPGPGFYHFPDWLPKSFYDEMTAERRGEKRWERPEGKPPNETFDLCVLGEAAILRLGADRIDWNNPPAWAAEWDDNPDIRRDDEPAAPPPARPRLRVARSKYMGR